MSRSAMEEKAMSSEVELARYDNSWYTPGRGKLLRAAWLFAGQPLFGWTMLPSSGLRVALLRLFGATVGRGVVIHSGVQVKNPWHLVVGDHCWIGEHAWIDNLTTVRLGNNVCISQGVYVCTGNHDYKDPAFGLMLGPVSLADGSWAGARSILLPNARLEASAVAAAGAVVSGTVPPGEIYAGNPATFLRMRHIRGKAAGVATRSTVQR